MGNSASGEERHGYYGDEDDYAKQFDGIETLGYRVLGVQPDSPASKAGLVSFFDFIVGANQLMLMGSGADLQEGDEYDDVDFPQLLRDNIDRPVHLLVWNIKARRQRVVELIPRDNWGGAGLLGVTIKLDDYGGADERLVRVLEVVGANGNGNSNANSNANSNGNSNGNTKPKRKHPRTQPRTHPQPQPQPHPQTPRLIHEHDLCRAFHHARNIAGFQTPHVLLTHLNENWGALSTEVANRTHEWGDVVKNWRGHSEPCDPLELKELYLDSPHTLAVFTVQHQALFDHPKVHSIPIGVGNSRDGANALLNSLLRQAKRWQPHGGADAPHRRRGRRLQPNTTESSDPVEGDPRPQLLMINSSPTPTRTPQIEAVIRNFQESGLPEARGLTNTYGEKGVDKHTDARTLYHNEISRSKFILCPSGIGWDTYRIWESIVLGAIPVIEKHRYEYEKIVYPPSANKRPRLLHSQEHWNAQKMRRHLRRFNATLETVGYYDGWRKSMDDLPVLWIDGTFGDELTPELLVEQYDALAGRAAEFRYEKLTSLYWMQFLESFLLNHNANGNGNHDALVWQRAMETLSSTFNDHSTSVKKFMKQAAAKQIDDDLVQVGDDGAGDDAGVRAGVGDGGDVDDGDGTDGAGVPSYLFGSRQPEILSWVLFAELKLVGIVLVVVAIRRWDADANADAAKSDPDKTNGDVGSKR
mmetsp:Transcript_25477/g.53057  ORF Transcript_25477/g.53057 Transcript_25477/m.53057 type:complete len:698 (+) Transcript_25477:326-2419(+)